MSAPRSNWNDFIASPRAAITCALALLAVLLIGLEPQLPAAVAAGQLLLALITLGCVAVLTYRVPEPDAATARS